MTDISFDDAKRKSQEDKYRGIAVFPAPHPEQRGPSCGFSALAYVMHYWFLQADGKLSQPLPARTQMHIAHVDTDAHKKSKEQKRAMAEQGTFTSLRHFAKFNSLTVVGSVFSANDLLAVAKGAQPGIYDGQVLSAHDAADFEKQVEAHLAQGIPVIVPYDVDTDSTPDGGPAFKGGEAAHWVAVLGSFDEDGKRQLLYFNWGGFQYAPLHDFARSNMQLRSNLQVRFVKCRVSYKGKLVEKDYLTEADIADLRKRGRTVEELREPVINYEYNEPATLASASASSAATAPNAHRTNGGLRCKLVVVFPIADASSSSSAHPSSSASTAPDAVTTAGQLPQ